MPRRVIIAACILAIAATSNTNSFGLVFVRAAEGIDLSVAALGGLRTIENAASILVALAVAPLVDRVPRKWVLLAGYGSATAATLILVALDSRIGTVFYFALNGAAIMMVFGALTAMPSDFVSGRALNRIMGIVIGCVAFTSILVAPIVGNVADVHGWRAGMLVSSGVTAMAFLLTLLLVPSYRVSSTLSVSGGFTQRYRAIMGRKSLLLMLGSNLLRFSLLAAMLTFMSTIFIQRYELSLSRIGLIFAGVGLMFFASSTLCGLVLHVLRTRRVLVWGGVVVVLLVFGSLVREVPLPVMIVSAVLLVGIVAAQENTGTIAVLRLSPDARGAAMSWNELAAGAGSLLGIGLGSIGMALGGITGLGIALSIAAIAGTAGSHIALSRSGYRDEDDAREPAQAPA
jgi:MFS transporter, DHA1 family, inner membrane transport protein